MNFWSGVKRWHIVEYYKLLVQGWAFIAGNRLNKKAEQVIGGKHRNEVVSALILKGLIKTANSGYVKLLVSEEILERCFYKKVLWKHTANYRRTPMPKCNFNNIAKQLYWNHTSPWELSCKFVSHFQNIFSKEHLCRAACCFSCNIASHETAQGLSQLCLNLVVRNVWKWRFSNL